MTTTATTTTAAKNHPLHEAAMAVTGLSGIVLMLTLGVIWRGFVLSILWGWFMVGPLGVPALSIPAAIGITLIVAYLVTSKIQESADRGVVSMFTKGALIPLFALGLGWIVARFL